VVAASTYLGTETLPELERPAADGRVRGGEAEVSFLRAKGDLAYLAEDSAWEQLADAAREQARTSVPTAERRQSGARAVGRVSELRATAGFWDKAAHFDYRTGQPRRVVRGAGQGSASMSKRYRDLAAATDL
jgi:hypothetical protein